MKKNWKLEIGNWKFPLGGFTMVEMLLYMGLLTLFLGVLSSLLGTAIDIQLESQADSNVTQVKQYVLARLLYDVRRSQSIVTPASIGATSNSLVLRINNANHTYSLDSNNNLVLANSLGSFVLNNYSTKVSSMSFTRYGNVGGVEDTINIDLLLDSRVVQNKGTESAQIDTTVGIRRQQ